LALPSCLAGVLIHPVAPFSPPRHIRPHSYPTLISTPLHSTQLYSPRLPLNPLSSTQIPHALVPHSPLCILHPQPLITSHHIAHTPPITTHIRSPSQHRNFTIPFPQHKSSLKRSGQVESDHVGRSTQQADADFPYESQPSSLVTSARSVQLRTRCCGQCGSVVILSIYASEREREAAPWLKMAGRS